MGTSYKADIIMPYGIGDPVVAPQRPRDPLGRGNRLTKHSWQLIFKRILMDFPADGMVDRGATLTYYAVLSMAPMLLAAYSIVTLLLPRGDAANELMADVITQYVPGELQEQALQLLTGIIGTRSQSTIALTVSIIISVLSASAYVRSFSRNANLIYGRTEGRNWWMTWLTMWLITVVMVVGAVVILLGTLLTDSIVNAVLGPIARPLKLEEELQYLTQIFLPVWAYVRWPVIVVTAIALISVLYYFAPNVRRGRFRVLTVGSTLALVVVALIWVLFGIYLSTIGVRSTYGAFGTVLAVMGLVWVMNIVLLEGVKIDAEILRAKELQVGLDSGRVIQAPPRSSDFPKFRLQLQRWANRSVRAIQDSQDSARASAERD